MKRLNSSKSDSDLAAIESPDPEDYEGGYSEGYYGAVSRRGEKQLLRSVFSTLRKHWFLILSFNLLITGVTIVYVAQKPDYYKAAARVQVNSENNPAGGGRGGSITVNNPGSDPAYFTTQLQILESGQLLRRVIKSLDLENNENFLNPRKGKRLTVWQNVRKMFGLYQPAPPAQLDPNEPAGNKLDLNNETFLEPDKETEKFAPLVALLKRNLTISPVKDSRTKNAETRLIEIEFTHEDPKTAAKIANAISDAYVLQNLEQKVQSNASAGDFLQKRVGELQTAIRNGEERLLNYSKNNQIISLDANQNTVVQRLTSLNQQLGQAENERIAAQTVYQAAVQNQMRAATAESKDSQVLTLEAKLNDLRQKLAQLKTEYTDEWPEVVQIKKQIESIEIQLSGIRKRASDIQIAALEEKLNEAVAREKELRNNFDRQRADVVRQNEASINYRIIQQEIDTNKSLLNGLLERSRENDVILNDTPNNVLVADRALVPRSPIESERSKNIVLAFIVSLGAGCGFGFLLDWLSDSVNYSEEIENDLGLPLLAAIPATPLGIGERLVPNKVSLNRKKNRGKDSYNLAAFEMPEFAEAYLQLRTCLMLSTAGGPPRSILVTSGEEGEGKSITAVNLAVSMSKTGGRILLIDADLRCPRVHIIKELNNDAGLTTLLTVKEIDDQLLEKTIQKDSTSSLHILTAGDRSVNPANLLCSEEMRALLANLTSKYNHIIIDSPPALYFADSIILSALVDSVIIVVRDNKSSKQTVLKAKKMLQNVGAKVIGVVLNGIPRRLTHYRQYKYYEMEARLASEEDYQTLKLN